MTTYGAAQFQRMIVWTDPVEETVGAAAAGAAANERSPETADSTEALVLDRGHD